MSSKCPQTAAAAACGEQGGRLLELEGGAELAALAAWLRAMEPPCLYEAAVLWLGIRNTTAAGASSWVADSTGQTIAFSHWLDTEPNHAGTRRCAPPCSQAGGDPERLGSDDLTVNVQLFFQ